MKPLLKAWSQGEEDFASPPSRSVQRQPWNLPLQIGPGKNATCSLSTFLNQETGARTSMLVLQGMDYFMTLSPNEDLPMSADTTCESMLAKRRSMNLDGEAGKACSARRTNANASTVENAEQRGRVS